MYNYVGTALHYEGDCEMNDESNWLKGNNTLSVRTRKKQTIFDIDFIFGFEKSGIVTVVAAAAAAAHACNPLSNGYILREWNALHTQGSARKMKERNGFRTILSLFSVALLFFLSFSFFIQWTSVRVFFFPCIVILVFRCRFFYFVLLKLKNAHTVAITYTSIELCIYNEFRFVKRRNCFSFTAHNSTFSCCAFCVCVFSLFRLLSLSIAIKQRMRREKNDITTKWWTHPAVNSTRILTLAVCVQNSKIICMHCILSLHAIESKQPTVWYDILWILALSRSPCLCTSTSMQVPNNLPKN